MLKKSFHGLFLTPTRHIRTTITKAQHRSRRTNVIWTDLNTLKFGKLAQCQSTHSHGQINIFIYFRITLYNKNTAVNSDWLSPNESEPLECEDANNIHKNVPLSTDVLHKFFMRMYENFHKKRLCTPEEFSEYFEVDYINSVSFVY